MHKTSFSLKMFHYTGTETPPYITFNRIWDLNSLNSMLASCISQGHKKYLPHFKGINCKEFNEEGIY